MKRLFFAGLILAVSLLASPADAQTHHFWRVYSPEHDQTFAYGSERNRVWLQWGHDRHLVLMLKYTNDPYVDRDNPRLYDTFFFPFPGITLGKDGHTFYYRTPSGRSIPVAEKRPDFLGVNEVKLLPNAVVIVDKPHGYLTVRLDILDPVAR